MAGAILTNQQAMQKIIGCYYIFQARFQIYIFVFDPQ